MKKRTRILLLVALLALGWAGRSALGTRPLRGLAAADIRSAEVRLSPPDVTVPVPDAETLAELLRAVVVYRRDASHGMYAGQGAVFTLELTDGTRLEITAFNPFVILDGVGYRCRYEPCEALNQYANALLRKQAGGA